MKVWLRQYEEWPVYQVDLEGDDRYDVEAELTEDEVADFQRVAAEFEAWRLRLYAMYHPNAVT